MSWRTCARCEGKFWPASPAELTCGRCFDHPEHAAFRELFGLGGQAFAGLSDEDFLKRIKVRLT